MNKQTEALKLALEACLCREMPEGTIIGDPKWWVPKIAAAIEQALSQPDAFADGGKAMQGPVAFLAESTRFKVTLTERDCKITGLPRELGGRWVALVGAENDCHLRLTAPPKRQPLTEAQIDTGRRAPWGLNLDAFTSGVRFAEAAHKIT